MKYCIYINIILALCLSQLTALSQNHEDIVKNFPDADVVYSKYDKHLKIFMKDGVPIAESHYDIDMLMLTDKNSNMISRYKVHHSGYSELKSLDAYSKVLSPNNKKTNQFKVDNIQTTSSTESWVFYDDSKESVFDFPSLTQYSIAHVDYKLHHKDAHLLSPFYLPGYLPVIDGNFIVSVPRGIEIKYIVKNDPDNKFVLRIEEKQKERIYRWTVKNVPSTTNYGNAPDQRHFVPHIIIHIASYQDKSGVQPFLSSLSDLYKWNYAFTKEINPSVDPALKKFTDSLIAGLNTDVAKADKIYKWVQNNIKYIAFENGVEGFRPRHAADVYLKRYGDCKDMASILTQMLRITGINAYYTWIGTRDIPYSYLEVPLPISDNHMISAALIDNKWHFLDATNSFSDFQLPPASIQGKEALIAIAEGDYKIVTVPVADAHINMIEDSTFLTMEDHGVKGHQTVNYSGYFGQDIYTAVKYRSEKEIETYVKSRTGKGSNKFKLGKFSVNRTNPEINFANIFAEFEIPGYSKKIGDNYYINLNVEKLLENQVIDVQKRKIPIEHDHKYIIRQHHILQIPDSFKLTHVPKDFSMENDLVSINISYKVDGKKIIATQIVENKTLMIYPKDFDKWNAPMKAVINEYKQSIVLEKETEKL